MRKKQFEREKQVRLLEQESKGKEELQQIQQEVMEQQEKMIQEQEEKQEKILS